MMFIIGSIIYSVVYYTWNYVMQFIIGSMMYSAIYCLFHDMLFYVRL